MDIEKAVLAVAEFVKYCNEKCPGQVKFHFTRLDEEEHSIDVFIRGLAIKMFPLIEREYHRTTKSGGFQPVDRQGIRVPAGDDVIYYSFFGLKFPKSSIVSVPLMFYAALSYGQHPEYVKAVNELLEYME